MSLDKPLSRYSGPTISIYIHMRKRRVKHRSVEDQGLVGPQLAWSMYPTFSANLRENSFPQISSPLNFKQHNIKGFMVVSGQIITVMLEKGM